MAISTLQQALGGINSQVSESVAKVVHMLNNDSQVCNVFLDKIVSLSQCLYQSISIWVCQDCCGTCVELLEIHV